MKKSIKVIIWVVGVVSIIGGVIGCITYHDNCIYQEISKQIIVIDKAIELQAEAVEISVNDIVNVSDLNCTVSFENGNDKIIVDADTIGEQVITIIVTPNNTLLSDKSIKLAVKIIIVDTTPPEFTESIDEIKIDEGEQLDLLSKFQAKDLSGDVEITVKEAFNNSKAGNYNLTVIAKDFNGNIAEKEVRIVVEEKVTTSTNSNSTTRNTNKPSNNGSSGNSSIPSSGGGSSNNNSSSNNNGGGSSSKPNWCWEGGSKHVISAGIGWYSSYNQARDAASAYAKNKGITSFHYEIQECDCGKFTAYVR